tara:strand:+ start:4639 stop:5334 length:696 start_codon:yes stop_codon:yes gene_type:complete
MGWLSDKWDELTGKNQQVATSTVNAEYDKAYGEGREAYGDLKQRGYDMMDPDSAFNKQMGAQMQEASADSAAEASRLAQRNIAMGGGGNATATAFNAADQANNAAASANDSYNKYLQGAMSAGTGLVSGAANNLTSMNQNQMNAVSNQRLANAQIDSQATGFGANLLGKGMQMAFGMPPVLQEGGPVDMYQDGGYVESAYGNSGGMLSQVMGPDGIPMNIKTRIGGQVVGE